MTELKNCPFCGSEAKLVNEFHVHYAICLNDKCVTFGPNGATEAEAIAAWNKRTYDVAELAQLEAVKRLVEAAQKYRILSGWIGGPDAAVELDAALAALEVNDAK